MRLLLVVPAFPRLSETFIVNKFVGLVERGLDVHVWCGKSDARDWARFPALAGRAELRRRVHASAPTTRSLGALLRGPSQVAVDLLAAPHAATRYLRRTRHGLGWRALKHLYVDSPLLRIRPDVVHFEFGSMAVERSYLLEAVDGKVVVSFRGADICFSGLEQPDFYEAVWRRADALHFLGEDLRSRTLARGCPPATPHRMIAPAIDVAAFAGLATPRAGVLGTAAQPLRLLTVARLEWKKGHEHLLDAAARLVRAGIHLQLRLVGGGAAHKAIAFARHQLGLQDRVELLGPRAPDEVRQQLAWADVFVHAAVSEGFCNAVIEAQAAGLPVVTSDAEGLRENVADGETGFVVPRRDPQAMADRIAALAADAALRRRMAGAGPARARRLFQLERQLDQWVDFYREVVRAS